MEPHGFKQLLTEADTYLAFFKRRVEIEDAYADQLTRLAVQDVEIQSQLYTVKSAWSALRREVSREAESRRRYANLLRTLVHDPLSSFRDSKERVRKRIKDELKASANDHNEYKGSVSRLQKAYERKCEEVRSLQMHDTIANAVPPSTSPDSHPPLEHSPPTSPSSSNAAMSGPSSASNVHVHHQPLVAGAISLSMPTTPLNPPGPTTATARAQDAIKASRRELNSLIQRIGGDVPQARGESTSVRTSRLRREAEDADNQYRRAVFHLETLRIRRERVLQSSWASAEEFALDLSSFMRQVLGTSVELVLENTAETNEACHFMQQRVADVSPELDVTDFAKRLPADPPVDAPVLYNNCYVGPCKSLQFGIVSLTDYASTHGGTLVPVVIQLSIAEIEARGLDHEGIYRVSGRTSAITNVVLEIERDEHQFHYSPTQHGPDTVAGVLKLFLRQLPSPVFPLPHAERQALSKAAEGDDVHEALTTLTKRLRRLAPAHQATLKALCGHLAKVADHEATNRMGATNLGLVFAPVIFGEDDPSTLAAAASGAGQASVAKDHCMELLIRHQAALFDGLPVQETPLPDSRVRGRALSDASGHVSDEEFPLRNRSASSATASRKSASIRRTRSPLSRPQRTAQTPSPRASLDLRPPATPPPRSPSAPLQRALHSSPPMSAPPTVAHSPTPPAVHPLHQVPPLVAPDPISPYAYFEAYDAQVGQHAETPPAVLSPSRRESGTSLPPGAAPAREASL